MVFELAGAAGAVEYHFERARSLLSEVQHWADQEGLTHGSPESTVAHLVGSEGLEQFAWEYRDTLSWARSFDDRLKLTPPGPSTAGDIGFVEALNPGHPATPRIRRVWEIFHGSDVVTDLRNQTGVALHVSTIQATATGASVSSDGRVAPLAPDPVMRPVVTRLELSYDQGREAITTLQEVWGAVGKCMDGIIGTFEFFADLSPDQRAAIRVDKGTP